MQKASELFENYYQSFPIESERAIQAQIKYLSEGYNTEIDHLSSFMDSVLDSLLQGEKINILEQIVDFLGNDIQEIDPRVISALNNLSLSTSFVGLINSGLYRGPCDIFGDLLEKINSLRQSDSPSTISIFEIIYKRFIQHIYKDKDLWHKLLSLPHDELVDTYGSIFDFYSSTLKIHSHLLNTNKRAQNIVNHFHQTPQQYSTEIESGESNESLGEMINIIKKLPLLTTDKFYLFLTLIGEKPASILYPKNKKYLELISGLKKLPIKFYTSKRELHIDQYNFFNHKIIKPWAHESVYVGKHESDIEFFKSQEEVDIPTPQDDIITGNLLGYPQTAVEAFTKGDIMDDEIVENYLEENGFSILIGAMCFSRNNWQNEIEELRHWQELLEKYFPEWNSRDEDVLL